MCLKKINTKKDNKNINCTLKIIFNNIIKIFNKKNKKLQDFYNLLILFTEPSVLQAKLHFKME